MIIPVNKPRGLSSYDIVRKFKKLYPGVKIGHAGTLDPQAEGLLLILTEKDTKRQEELMQLKKTYQFDVVFGAKSDTQDLEGPIEIIERDPKNVSELISKTNLLDICSKLTGEIELEVPRYAANKIGGQPAYKLARAGKDFAQPFRKSTIYSLDLPLIGGSCEIKPDYFIPEELKGYPCLRIVATVGKGTYIRALAEKIALEIGTAGIVTKLVRTQIGDYKLEDAESLSWSG